MAQGIRDSGIDRKVGPQEVPTAAYTIAHDKCRIMSLGTLHHLEALEQLSCSRASRKGMQRDSEQPGSFVPRLVPHAVRRRIFRHSDLRFLIPFLVTLHSSWPVAFGQGKAPSGGPVIDQALTADVMPTWRAMEDLVDKGLVKHIGVSNFTAQRVQAVLDQASIKPAVSSIIAPSRNSIVELICHVCT